MWEKGNLVKAMVLAAALAVAYLGAGVRTARANGITLDVSGTLRPLTASGAGCGSSGCSITGTLVIDNSSGAPNGGFVSSDITMSGEIPPLTSFTEYDFTGTYGAGSTELWLTNPAGDTLDLDFDTPTSASLVGFSGGGLVPTYSYVTSGPTDHVWFLNAGSLTPTPEPASLMLFGTGLLGLAWLVRRRKAVSES